MPASRELAVPGAVAEYWTTALDFVQPIISTWTPANWIAFGTALASFGLSVVNSFSASSRGKKQNRREEFHRRVATPIEGVLEEFRAISDELLDIYDAGGTIPDADAVLRRANAVQRKLSRHLRNASTSGHCVPHNWDIGAAEYDRFMGKLDVLRTAVTADYCGLLKEAAESLEEHEKVIRKRINEELVRYT